MKSAVVVFSAIAAISGCASAQTKAAGAEAAIVTATATALATARAIDDGARDRRRRHLRMGGGGLCVSVICDPAAPGDCAGSLITVHPRRTRQHRPAAAKSKSRCGSC